MLILQGVPSLGGVKQRYVWRKQAIFELNAQYLEDGRR